MPSPCTVDGFLDGLALQLKDCTTGSDGVRKHVRWTKEHLNFIMCLAASQLRSDRPDLFLETKRIKLKSGCYTAACESGCESIRGPIYLEGKECVDIDVVDKEQAEEKKWADSYFDDLSCPAPGSMEEEYSIETIIIDPEDPCVIKVNPEVPSDGIARYIVARCVTDPEEDFDGGNLPDAACKHLNAFTQLVLHYAYSMDSMVDADGSQAQQHFQNYIDLMQLSIDRALWFRDSRVLFGRLASNLGSD